MKKIAFWCNSFSFGGTDKTAVLFAKYLDKTKYQVDCFTYDDATIERKNDIERLFFIKRKDPDWSVLRTYNLIHSFRSGQFEIPEVGVSVHGPKFIITNTFGQLSNNKFINKDIFMSKWLMEYAVGKYNLNNRFDYINNPIEKPTTQEKLNEILRYKKGAIILGRAGRQDDGVYDNISVLAANEIQKRGYNIAFMCLGCPPSMKQDMDLFGLKYNIIEPTIDPIQISKFYNSIDIYCEGRPDGHTFGNVIAEAQMHGKPCIVHRAIPKYQGMGVFQNQLCLVDHLTNGLHSEYDFIQYANMIEILINNHELRNQMEVNAKAKAIKEYDVEIGIAKLEKIYQEVLIEI